MSVYRHSAAQSMPPGAIGVVGLAALLAAVAGPWQLLAVAIALGMAAIGWSRPALGLGFAAATIPVQEGVLIPVGPVDLTVTQLVLLPMLAGWIAAWLLGRVELPLNPPVIAWGLITASLALSLVTATDEQAWAREVYRWGIALLFFAVASASLRCFSDAKPLLAGVAAGVLLSATIALWQVATGAGPPTYESSGLMRAYALFGSPNPLAAYLEMSVLLLAPMAVVLARSGDGAWWQRYGLAMVVSIGSGTLLSTQSRGGLLGFIAGASVIAWFLARWSRQLLLLGCSIVIVLALLTPAGRSGAERFLSGVTAFNVKEQTTPANWSIHERVAHWRAGLRMLRAEPVTGVGAGNFDARYREMTGVWRFRIPRGHAHNSAIQLGAQAGYVGLIAYLALFFTAGARIARSVRSARGECERALALGGLGVLIAVAVHGQFDYLHGLNLNLALVLALAVAEPALHSARDVGDHAGASR